MWESKISMAFLKFLGSVKHLTQGEQGFKKKKFTTESLCYFLGISKREAEERNSVTLHGTNEESTVPVPRQYLDKRRDNRPGSGGLCL